MGYVYALLGGYMGELISQNGEVTVWECRPEIKRWRNTELSGKGLEPTDQPPLYEMARFFEEFWTSGEPLPTYNGLHSDRRVEVLKVVLEPGRL